VDYIDNFLALALEAAPWLIVGLLLGGMMKALLPTRLLEKHLKGRGFGAIVKAALMGAPLPLCSCGVIPAALGLRQAGASKPATVSFLVSTPETGVDSISITYALMGPFMAIVRPIAALLSAISAGLLVNIFVKEAQSNTDNNGGTCNSHCCSTSENDGKKPVQKISFVQKAGAGISYAFSTLLVEIAGWLVLGLLFAAAVQTYLPSDFLAQWGHGITAMLIMVLAGIPMYICATASTPVAVGLMIAGVSPGVALVLLLTGPATNVSTLGIIAKKLGKQTMLYYLLGTIGTALLSGLAVDYLVEYYAIDVTMQLNSTQMGIPLSVQILSLLALCIFGVRSCIVQLRRNDTRPAPKNPA